MKNYELVILITSTILISKKNERENEERKNHRRIISFLKINRTTWTNFSYCLNVTSENNLHVG